MLISSPQQACFPIDTSLLPAIASKMLRQPNWGWLVWGNREGHKILFCEEQNEFSNPELSLNFKLRSTKAFCPKG